MNPYFRVGTVWIRLDALNCAMLGEVPHSDGGTILRLYFNHDPEPVELFDADALAAWEYLCSLAGNMSPESPETPPPALIRGAA